MVQNNVFESYRSFVVLYIASGSINRTLGKNRTCTHSLKGISDTFSCGFIVQSYANGFHSYRPFMILDLIVEPIKRFIGENLDAVPFPN